MNPAKAAASARRRILELNKPGVVKGKPPIKSAQVVLGQEGYRVEVVLFKPYGSGTLLKEIDGVPVVVIGFEDYPKRESNT